MRIAKACKKCRVNKRRSRVGNVGPCEQCIRKHVSCSLDVGIRAERNRAGPATIPPQQLYEATSSPLLLELVVIYLEVLHGKPHTLFHPPRLRQRVREGKLSNRVVYSIAGLAVRFHTSQAIQERKDHFMKLAKADLKANMDDFTLGTI